jgi:hypothetical protein
MQLGFIPYDNNGNFVAAPFAAVNGNFPYPADGFHCARDAVVGVWRAAGNVLEEVNSTPLRTIYR